MLFGKPVSVKTEPKLHGASDSRQGLSGSLSAKSRVNPMSSIPSSVKRSNLSTRPFGKQEPKVSEVGETVLFGKTVLVPAGREVDKNQPATSRLIFGKPASPLQPSDESENPNNRPSNFSNSQVLQNKLSCN